MIGQCIPLWKPGTMAPSTPRKQLDPITLGWQLGIPDWCAALKQFPLASRAATQAPADLGALGF